MSARAEMEMHDGDLRCHLITARQRTTFVLAPLEAMALADALKDYAGKVLATHINGRLAVSARKLEGVK